MIAISSPYSGFLNVLISPYSPSVILNMVTDLCLLFLVLWSWAHLLRLPLGTEPNLVFLPIVVPFLFMEPSDPSTITAPSLSSFSENVGCSPFRLSTPQPLFLLTVAGRMKWFLRVTGISRKWKFLAGKRNRVPRL